MNHIITLGREFGSGGRELARRLAEEMGYAYYDHEIIGEIAKRTELSEKYVQSVVDSKPNMVFPIHVGRSFQLMEAMPATPDQSVYSAQCTIIKELAEKSNCLIVGRCADYILKDHNPFRIFVCADIEAKVARCRRKVPEEKMTDRELKKFIRQMDKSRAAYYEFYTNQQWGSKYCHDLCVNTTKFEIKDLVPHIASMILYETKKQA